MSVVTKLVSQPKMTIRTKSVGPTSPMLHDKDQVHQPSGSEVFLKSLTIYKLGGHLSHATRTNIHYNMQTRIHMKPELNWPSSF